jgi:hypothetical protein
MSKKRFEKRRLKAKKRRSQQQVQHKSTARKDTVNVAPSAPTIWRSTHLDVRTQEMLMSATIQYQPSVLTRDAKKTRKVEDAVDLEALLDLTPIAGGIAESVWYGRMQEFVPAAAGSIADRLSGDWIQRHAKDRSAIQERCIGVLRWCGEDGVDALLACWDALDDYGRSIACVALGLLGDQRSGDYIWDHYQKVRSTRENLFVGPLWGLIDLQDQRVADALATFLDQGHEFYEMYGFMSRGGDKRFIFPLIALAMLGPDKAKGEATWALTGIAHRLGREALAAELRNSPEPDKVSESDVESFLDKIFKYSAEDVERHFEVFYDTDGSSLQGFSAQDKLVH